ncbi:hypothetical protein M430DRAFT_60985 [Amorphotheca resinae ATCC 22711]|uniref:MARVEL domain-containing protein n=1 Tax=Amorphotheca resinae ATCC 22711 TaxID=857342 RepID=A0A2T3ASS5_AMORE|nr:hypothetical protein M430DRAFT_60985 [Amorphotheca resinae ATCC 22711]PSS10548.1 hypothetical protein M430DRAFT_60985 [Amorphotheca resinae ATCC 22711]
MSTAHVLPQPKFLLGIRIAQLVVGITVLGLAAYGVTDFSFDGDSLMLFTALATIIISSYVLLASLVWPIIYNYWALLGLDIFSIIFWIISFSLLASEIADYSWAFHGGFSCAYDAFTGLYDLCARKRGVLGKRDSVYTYRNALAAACGLGGLEFILFTITLIFLSLHLHRHRKADGHCTPSKAPVPAPPAEPKDVELQNAQEPVYYPPPAEGEVA